MNLVTVILAVGFDGGLVFLTVRAWRDIRRFGPAMIAGIAAAWAAVLLGQFGHDLAYFDTVMGGASIAALALIVFALYTHRGQLGRRPEQ